LEKEAVYKTADHNLDALPGIGFGSRLPSRILGTDGDPESYADQDGREIRAKTRRTDM
jgi:hypothetical protein